MDQRWQAARIRVPDDVLFQDLKGESVLLDLRSGTYFGLDLVGTRVWQLLAAHRSISDIATALTDEFDVPRDQCVDDLRALLDALSEQGLVTVEV